MFSYPSYSHISPTPQRTGAKLPARVAQGTRLKFVDALGACFVSPWAVAKDCSGSLSIKVIQKGFVVCALQFRAGS